MKKNIETIVFLISALCFLSISCNRNKATDFLSDINLIVTRDTLKLDKINKNGTFLHFLRNDSVFFASFENDNIMRIYLYENNCNCLKEHKTHIVSDSVFNSNDEYGRITKIISQNDNQFWFYKTTHRGTPHDLFLYDFSKNMQLCSYKTTNQDFFENKLEFLIFDEFVLNPYNNKLITYINSVENKCTELYYKNKEKCILAEISCDEENDRRYINIRLPDIYDSIKNGDYSYDSFIYLATGQDNKIIVSFAISQQILILNSKTMEYHYVEPNHKNFRAPIKNDLSNQLYSYDIFVRNAYRSFTYHNLIYNPYKQEYYRFYQTEMPDKKVDGTFTTAEDMKIGVFVMSKDFEPIGDYLLSDEDKFHVRNNNTIPTEKGFVCYIINEENEIVFIKFERE